METEGRIGKIIRLTLGLVLIIYGINYFYPLMNEVPQSALANKLYIAMKDTRYMLPAIYITELILGVCIFFRLFAPLAYLLTGIIALNYLVYAIFINKPSIMNSAILLLLVGYKIYQSLDIYRYLLNDNEE